ncbi:MAG: SUF system Fe-S cluster assembly protein [Planctomycetota bacterium]
MNEGDEAIEAAGDAAEVEIRAAGLQAEEGSLEDRVVKAMESCFDPEIPVNIYELGLIYRVDICDSKVDVDMTLTSPACPVAGTLPGELEQKVQEVDGVEECKVGVVWDPPWTKDRMTESARLQLGMF